MNDLARHLCYGAAIVWKQSRAFLLISAINFSGLAAAKAYLVHGGQPTYLYPDDYTEQFRSASNISEAAGNFFWKRSNSKAAYYRVDNDGNDIQITVSSDIDASRMYDFLNTHLTEHNWYYLSIDFSKFSDCRQKFLFAGSDIEFIVYDAGAVKKLGAGALEKKNFPKYFWLKLRPEWKKLVNVETFCTSK